MIHYFTISFSFSPLPSIPGCFKAGLFNSAVKGGKRRKKDHLLLEKMK
jgi:hypothetical protein